MAEVDIIREIPVQVRLPVRVALEVVLQGIRIRLGRSLVTLTGVVCGIAFLMSILTGQIIRAGVQEEDALRQEVSRMEHFLLADTGGVAGRSLSLYVGGALDAVEARFLEHQLAVAAGAVLVQRGGGQYLPAGLEARVEEHAPQDLMRASGLLLVMGAAHVDLPPAVLAEAEAKHMLVATTREGVKLPDHPGREMIVLARAQTAEDLAAAAQAARQDRFRSIWIVVISLLVTVIGISNAMLMSVTERFREIGTMKCLGALSIFIRRIFLLESSLMGFVGGVIGALGGGLFAYVVYAFTYGWGLVGVAVAAHLGLLAIFLGVCLLAGVGLSMIAALYPARVAARMVPAHALRSNV